MSRVYDRLGRLEDRNIDSVNGAEDRGEAFLRNAEIESGGGEILVPANCGQQLYDVIDITDANAGLSAAGRRVLGMDLTYNPALGRYEHRLHLGMV